MDTPAQPQEDERQSQLKLLIAKGKEQGYLTYSEVNDHLPSEIVDPEQIEDIVNMINDMGITVYEKAPDAESLMLSDSAVSNDEDAAEEAAAALATVDAEFGRTTDPVRMYMREMGTVELLTREGEIRIAKRIEEGLDQVRSALVQFPPTCQLIFDTYDAILRGETRLQDLITGFIDPNEQIADPNARAAGQPPSRRTKKRATIRDDEETAAGHRPDPEEVAARLKKVKRLHKSTSRRSRRERREEPGDEEGAQGAHERVHGAQARAEGVRRDGRAAARHGQPGARPRASRDGAVRARRRNAAQGLHRELPEERDEPHLDRQAHSVRSASIRPRSASSRKRSSSAQKRLQKIEQSTVARRSATSRTSIARSRSARRKRAARRKRWSRRTCGS